MISLKPKFNLEIGEPQGISGQLKRGYPPQDAEDRPLSAPVTWTPSGSPCKNTIVKLCCDDVLCRKRRDTFSHRSTMFPNALQRLDRSLTLPNEPEIDGCFTVVLKLARRIYFYFIGKPPGWLLWLTVLKYCAILGPRMATNGRDSVMGSSPWILLAFFHDVWMQGRELLIKPRSHWKSDSLRLLLTSFNHRSTFVYFSHLVSSRLPFGAAFFPAKFTDPPFLMVLFPSFCPLPEVWNASCRRRSAAPLGWWADHRPYRTRQRPPCTAAPHAPDLQKCPALPTKRFCHPYPCPPGLVLG